MKSAIQTLEEDKATLQEYKIFITIAEIYKKVYSHCKNCYNKALIKSRFEGTKQKGYRGQTRGGCNDKNCRSCNKRVQNRQSTDPQTQTEVSLFFQN